MHLKQANLVNENRHKHKTSLKSAIVSLQSKYEYEIEFKYQFAMEFSTAFNEKRSFLRQEMDRVYSCDCSNA